MFLDTPKKTRSRPHCGPAVFAISEHCISIKSTTLTGFFFSIRKAIIHFRWYLHDFEAMKSYFSPVLAFTFNTRVLKKPDSFASARGCQVRQVLQRLSDAPVGSANERKNIVSDGIIHISSQLMLVAQLLRKDFFSKTATPTPCSATSSASEER